MSVLDRKLRRDLLNAKGVLASILLVIVIGIACFVGMASVWINLENARSDYYTQCRMADFWIDLKKAPTVEIDALAEMPGIASLQSRIVFRGTLHFDDADELINAMVISLPDDAASAINGLVMRRGSGFSDDRLEEVVVNEAFARARGLRPGDDVQVILNNRLQTLRITGTALSSEFVYLMSPGGLFPDPEHYGVLYVKRAFAEDAIGFNGACNQVVGRLSAETRDHPDVVLAQLEHALDAYGVLLTTPRRLQASHQILTDELSQLRISALVLPTIFLAVAVLVLNILMSRIAEQQRTIVGTLKALGYTDRELMRHYLMFSALVGCVGGIIGIVLGYWFAAGMTEIYHQYFEFPDFENRATPIVYGAGIVLSIVFALVGSLRGVRRVVKLRPAEAMRAKPPALGRPIVLERWHVMWNRLNFRSQMALRSVCRNKLRAAAGMFAATMGGALLFTTFYFLDSMQYMIDFQFDRVLRSDVDLVFRDTLDDDGGREAARLTGVDRAESQFILPCEFRVGHRTKRAGISGIDAGSIMTIPRFADGTPALLPEIGLLMGRRMAELLNVRAGETVEVAPITGRREPFEAPVAQIIDGFFGTVTYADRSWLARQAGERDAVSIVQLQLAPGEQTRSALNRELAEMPVVESINDNRYLKRQLETTLLDALWYSIVALVALAGAIFFGSILTTSLIAVSERRREIATLIVMGHEPRQVGSIFLRESLFVNVVGAALAVPVGIGLSVWLISAHEREAFRLPIVTSPMSGVITIGLAIVFTLAAHLLVQRAISRLNWQDALNAQE